MCGLAVLFTYDNLRVHLVSRHKISLHVYSMEHLPDSAAGRRRRSLSSAENKNPVTVDEEEIPDVSSIKLEEQVTNACTAGSAESADLPGSDPDISEAEQIFSDNSVDMCRLECNICKASVKKLRGHAKKHHNMNLGEFKIMHPKVVYTLKTFHRYRKN